MARAILLIDIKEYLIALEEKVDFFHDVDDETMDQMKEVVAVIKEGKDILDKKVNYSDIVDNLDSDDNKKVLSAKQGKELRELIDEMGGGITEESDPTVPEWAKQPTKPTYTASEIGADAAGLAAAVQQNLTTHKTDTSVHLQSGEREKWNAIKSVESVVQSVKGSGSDAANVWTMTFSDGSTSTFTVKNGSQGERGLQGVQGIAGEPFGIAKIYASVSAMNAGYSTDGVGIGKFVLINTGNVEDEDNAKLYVKGANAYSYITDLSGAEGMQGPQGVQGVQGPAGSDGDPGRRGTGILTINSPPTADPSGEWAYRIALSTVLLQSEADEVIVGDTLAQSYYLYNVGAVDSSYVYLKGRRSIRGATGAAGAAGADYIITDADKTEIAEQAAALVDVPTITQEAGESESLVMSQKAVTDLVKNAVGSGGTTTEYETVDSVEEMTDTSKQYVLSSTGTLWTYGEVSEDINEQIFDASKVFGGHMSGVNISSSTNKIYPLSVDTSQIPDGVVAYVEINGFYLRNTTAPTIEKIGWSTLESPAVGNSQLIFCTYAEVGSDTDHFNSEELFATTNGVKIKVGYKQGSKFDAYDTIKTLLLEIKAATTHDASTITAYLQYSGTVTKWYDTGLTPSASGGGGNYVELLVKINQNASDIYEVSERVTALETGSDSVTIPTFWQSAVDACITKIKALQVGRNCVTFPFFSDNHQRNGYAGMLIAHIMKECNIPYCFYGGDSISSGTIADEATMIAQDKAFDTIMSYVPNGRLCRAVGNHDGYWYDGTNKYYYDRDQVYELFLREESIAQNKHFGDDGTYYYVDEIASKVRFIVLNTNGGSVDSTQISWLQNTALSFNESGWAVVFISHQPISNHYHAGISNAAEVRTVVANYINGSSANKADVVGWFSGHIHRDRIYSGIAVNTSDDSEGTAMPFKQVVITSDHTGIAYDDATKHTVANDDKSHAIDFVTINKTTKTVNLTRLGIGEDRSYTY